MMNECSQHHFVRRIWGYLPISLLVICGLTACASSVRSTIVSTSSLFPTATSSSAIPESVNTPLSYSNHEVYLAVGALEFAKGGETNQIWRIDIDGISETLIYQAPRLLSIAGNDMLLPETVQEIREHFKAYPEEYPNSRFPDIDSLVASVELRHLALSPDARFLAWTEFYTWCPGNYCYGEARIKVLQMDNGNMLVDRRAKLVITSLVWVPDNQTLLFSEVFKDELSIDTYHIKQLDIRNGEITFIANGDAPVLSPDGQQLVVIDREPYVVSGLDIISLNDLSKQAVTSPIWTFISKPTWSPDGVHIAFVGSIEDGPTEHRTSIHTLNLQTLDLISLTIGSNIRFFNNPRWSPDGTLIAVDAAEEFFSGWNHLIVLDSQSGQVVSDFIERRNTSSWEWSNDGQSILFVKGFSPETKREIAIFHVATGNVTILPIPKAIQNSCCDGSLFFSDITW